jgi:hypothetical protein
MVRRQGTSTSTTVAALTVSNVIVTAGENIAHSYQPINLYQAQKSLNTHSAHFSDSEATPSTTNYAPLTFIIQGILCRKQDHGMKCLFCN